MLINLFSKSVIQFLEDIKQNPIYFISGFSVYKSFFYFDRFHISVFSANISAVVLSHNLIISLFPLNNIMVLEGLQ